MAPHSQPCPPLACPQCGRPMTRLDVDVPIPPYLVSLFGCAACGVTSNECVDPSVASTAAHCAHYEWGGK